ncbi:MAG: hypothetical protein Q9219_001022 [cf. Caloplaca sp. 3 TL-2023]
MRSTGNDDIDWDFTPVSDLIFSLSGAPDPNTNEYSSPSPSPEKIVTPTFSPNQSPPKSDLGNFDKLWAFLGQPLDLPPPEVPSLPEDYVRADIDENAKLHLTINKGVRWRDDTEGGELADVEEAGDRSTLAGLTKQQRKKLRRKERKAARGERANSEVLPTSSSGDESEIEFRDSKRPSDRRAVIHQILHGSIRTTEDGSPTPKGVTGRVTLPINLAAWPVAKPHTAGTSPRSRAHTGTQAAIVSEAAKKERLMRKLKERFIDDRPLLDSLSMKTFTSTDNTGLKEGIHVFVDASNIMIGFHDSLKLSRGLSIHARLRRQPLSFDRLALILERGRPASKRILVGSDNIDAMEEARRIGYEINILERVQKAKELTPRQKRFSSRANDNTVANGTSGGSGSETTAALKGKWVEQAVDEILHLKILESVVDAKAPSTMVLATGDAAEAEYSPGFLRMAERALEKGWKVELVSFRKNMSGSYKRREFRTRWKGRFRILELDDFLEELLGCGVL